MYISLTATAPPSECKRTKPPRPKPPKLVKKSDDGEADSLSSHCEGVDQNRRSVSPLTADDSNIRRPNYVVDAISCCHCDHLVYIRLYYKYVLSSWTAGNLGRLINHASICVFCLFRFCTKLNFFTLTHSACFNRRIYRTQCVTSFTKWLSSWASCISVKYNDKKHRPNSGVLTDIYGSLSSSTMWPESPEARLVSEPLIMTGSVAIRGFGADLIRN